MAGSPLSIAITALASSGDFRFDSAEVRIRRHGAAVILEPVPQDWAWLAPLLGPVDADFEAAVATQPAEQERPGLDVFE